MANKTKKERGSNISSRGGEDVTTNFNKFLDFFQEHAEAARVFIH
jgi:hypothetical protein